MPRWRGFPVFLIFELTAFSRHSSTQSFNLQVFEIKLQDVEFFVKWALHYYAGSIFKGGDQMFFCSFSFAIYFTLQPMIIAIENDLL